MRGKTCVDAVETVDNEIPKSLMHIVKDMKDSKFIDEAISFHRRLMG